MNPLVELAKFARQHACAPFSKFRVGAAIEDTESRVWTGCNIENVSYGLTICAERVALFKALSEGVREFKCVVVYTEAEHLTPPCGACRQLLWEYCGDVPVTAANHKGLWKEWKMSELLPDAFDRRNLL